MLLPRILRASSGTLLAVWSWWQLDASPDLYLFDKVHRWRGRLRSGHPAFEPHGRQSSMSASYPPSQILWIIGASSGIGEAYAYQWISAQSGESSKLVLSARSVGQLQRVADECHRRNPQCQVYVHPLDVCDSSESLQAVIRSLPVNNIDTVWFNAGQRQLSPALHENTTPDVVSQTVQANALWTVRLATLLLRDQTGILRTHQPHFIISSSVAGHIPVPLSAIYAGSKHFLHGYFRSLVAETPIEGLSVDMICPGPVDTSFHTPSVSKSEGPMRYDVTPSAATTHQSKLKMSPERCAQLILSSQYQRTCRIFRPVRYREIWIANQPSLSVLYLNQFFPSFTQWLIDRIGSKRVELWESGRDLYDINSWKK